MNRLISIAVGIGLPLACGISYAGSPHGASHGASHVSHSVHTGHPSAAGHQAYAGNHVPSSHSHHGSELGAHHPYSHHGHSYGDLVVVARAMGMSAQALPNNYADALEAYNRYALATSQAAVNWQMAKSMAIRNQLEVAKARDEARRMNAAKYRSRQDNRLLANRLTAEEKNHLARPASLQLPPDQIDRQTGKIRWPEALQAKTFDAARAELDELAAASRPASRDLAKCGSREIGKRIEEIKNQLREQIREMPPMEYVAAHKFLDSLADELLSKGTELELATDSPTNR